MATKSNQETFTKLITIGNYADALTHAKATHLQPDYPAVLRMVIAHEPQMAVIFATVLLAASDCPVGIDDVIREFLRRGLVQECSQLLINVLNYC